MNKRMVTSAALFVCAAALTIAGFTVAKGALESSSPWDALFPMCCAFVLWMGAAVLLQRKISKILALPFLRFIDSIYLPGGHARKPPLNYDLAWHYEKMGRDDEALDEYRMILKYYPGELEAIAGMVRILDSDDLERTALREDGCREFGADVFAEAVRRRPGDLIDEKRLASMRLSLLGR